MYFTTNGKYKDDLKEYSEQILEKYGVSSESAEREIMCLADSGNTVACKLYADLIYYKKVLRKNFYRDAFELYLKSAGITVNEFGWMCSGNSYPLSFWTIGYYLINYKRESSLLNCETIDIIEEMSLEERFTIALKLAVTTVDHIPAAGAVNLIGRILFEISEDSNWNKRYRENMLRIRSGDLLEVASVIKSLVQRENARGLSTGERKMLHSAKQILISEIVLCFDCSYNEAEERLYNAFS